MKEKSFLFYFLSNALKRCRHIEWQTANRLMFLYIRIS